MSWPVLTVDELAAPNKSALATGPFGSSIGSKTFREIGVPVIRGSNLSAEVGTRLIDENLVFVDDELAQKFRRSIARRGDLVFTCWGTINQVGLIDEHSRYDQYLVSNKQMKFTPDSSKAIPLFLYYYFSSPDGQLQISMCGIGSSVPGFNLTNLRTISVPVPPLSEQEKIARVLGSLENKIELNRRMCETLEAMAQAIFRDWFVDYGPTRRKIAGATDPIEIMGGLVTEPDRAQQLAGLFPATFEESGLPEGWVHKPIGELTEIVGGATPSTGSATYWQ